MKNSFLSLFAFFFLLLFQNEKSIAQNNFRADSTLQLMKKVADWQLTTWEKEGMRWPKYDWTNGAAYAGFMALNEIANDSKYSEAMYRIGEDLGWNTGQRRTMADDYCVAQMFSQMYSLYRQPKMIEHFKQQADSIIAMPHTESLEWKNNIHLREWAWCDALFMGPPALAYLSTATGEKKYLDVANKLWWKTTDYLFDSTENLYFRDSRYFDKREANGTKMFWSRGNGWVMGGLVRMLENMPTDYPARPRYIDLYKRMAEKIASLQSNDGSWHASLLDAASYPAKETSGTGFFCYALAWGVNHGLLPYEKFNPAISKAWEALTSSVHADGKLGNVQQIGAQPESVDSNSTEVYGVGAFLLAGGQMIDMILKHSGNNPIISLYNKTGLDRKEEVVGIPYPGFISKIKNYKNQSDNYRIKISDALTGKEIEYQLEYRGNKNPQNVLVLINLAPGSKIYARITNEIPSDFTPKTYARFVPERYDDFAWENDKIAFRVYGKALEKIPGQMAYGQDVWAKRTSKLVINDWYKRANYHVDHGEGLDFYDVGFSLGAGSSDPYVNDSIYYSKNFRTQKVLDNGPLRSTFQLGYEAWNVNGTSVSESKIISLDAGSQLNRMETEYTFTGKKQLPVAIGIVKRKANGNMWLDEKSGIMGYWEPQHGKDGTLGIGSVMEEPVDYMKVADNHLLTVINAKSGKTFVYYTGAAWDKAGLITNSKEWFTYLQNFKEKIQRPVVVGWLK